MKTFRDGGYVIALCLVAMVATIGGTDAALSPHHYDHSCPQIYSIVKAEVQKAVAREARNAASLVRLHFHDCFVNGCDGSLLLDNVTGQVSEKFAIANVHSVRAFEVIDAIKAALEHACPHTVSCADILAIASRDSAVEAGLVPEYPVNFGRYDSFTANISAANESLPSPGFGYSQLKENFAKKGLNERDLVALSGAHTIGRVKCSVIRTFTLVGHHNISAKFLDFLNKTVCPPGSENPTDPPKNDTFPLTDLDLGTPNTFDTNYYKNIRKAHGMLPSDQALQSTPGVNQKYVAEFASDTSKFFHQFAKSTIKMGNISPKKRDDGEIRLNCRKRNPRVLRMVTSD